MPKPSAPSVLRAALKSVRSFGVVPSAPGGCPSAVASGPFDGRGQDDREPAPLARRAFDHEFQTELLGKAARQWQRLNAYDEPELLGDEWPGVMAWDPPLVP